MKILFERHFHYYLKPAQLKPQRFSDRNSQHCLDDIKHSLTTFICKHYKDLAIALTKHEMIKKQNNAEE